MKILLEDFYLHAVFKVRIFLFSVFSLTLEIVETLRTNIVSWYIKICSKYYTSAKLYTCTAIHKKSSLGNLKSSVDGSKHIGSFNIFFFKNASGHARTS